MEEKIDEVLYYIKEVDKKLNTLINRNDNKDSTEQQFRDFAINVAANLVGNAIDIPVILDYNKQNNVR